jgi:kumamolisin
MQPDRGLIPGSAREALRGAIPAVGEADPDAILDVQVILRRRGLPDGSPSLAETIRRAGAKRLHISRQELGERYGADPAELARVAAFGSRCGLRVLRTHATRRTVELRGRVADLEAAFAVRLQLYETPGGVFPGTAAELSVLPELAPLVRAVLGLDRRPIARPYFRRARPLADGAVAAAASSPLTPPQVAALYAFPPGTDGTGQRIALVELGGGYVEADLRTYFAGLGLPMPDLSVLSAGGTNLPSGDPQGPDAEVMLDLEVAGSLAPGARLLAVFAANDESGFVQAVGAAIHDTEDPPTVIAISWGEDESLWSAGGREALEDLFQDAAALGITVCAASGDLGSSDGVRDGASHVSFPAASSHVLACGGTSLTVEEGRRTGESVWNETMFGGGASGGGYSRVFPVPDYQAGLPGGPAGPAAGRGVPDVAGHADSSLAYTVLVDGAAAVLGGTSAVAPLWAALVARLNQSLSAQAGFLNPWLYRVPAAAGALHDVTDGSNGAFSAQAGWDACTGLGSPDGSVLLTTLRQSADDGSSHHRPGGDRTDDREPAA